MTEICRYVGIDSDFFSEHEFKRSNVTYSARFKPLHFIVIRLNRLLESALRQRPEIKTKLVALYKWFNQSEQGYQPMGDEIRKRVATYYEPCNRKLKVLLGNQEVPPWLG